MTLSDLAAVGSFVSGVAVVVTLVFLLLQMRQANRNQQSLMQQGRSVREVETMGKMLEPAMSAIIVRAEKLDPTLPSEDVQAYFRMCDTWVINFEDSFLQHRAGTADPTMWAHDHSAMQTLAAVPPFRIAWKYVRMYHSGAFRAFFDDLIRQAVPISLPDYGEVWKAGIEEEQASKVQS